MVVCEWASCSAWALEISWESDGAKLRRFRLRTKSMPFLKSCTQVARSEGEAALRSIERGLGPAISSMKLSPSCCSEGAARGWVSGWVGRCHARDVAPSPWRPVAGRGEWQHPAPGVCVCMEFVARSG